MGDDSKRHINAINIRAFVVWSQMIGVIREDDKEFGEIKHGPSDYIIDKPPSDWIEPERLGHLNPGQQQELLKILDEFADCFNETPGLCKYAVHEVHLSPEFKPKGFKAYRIPEVLHEEINWQFDDLLEKCFM